MKSKQFSGKGRHTMLISNVKLHVDHTLYSNNYGIVYFLFILHCVQVTIRDPCLDDGASGCQSDVMLHPPNASIT